MNWDTTWDRLVLPHFDLLVKQMTPKCFLDKLVAKGLVNRHEYVEIKKQTPPDQVRRLLIELLPTRSPPAYEIFRRVLLETPEQSYLVERYFPADDKRKEETYLEHKQDHRGQVECNGQSQVKRDGIHRQDRRTTSQIGASRNDQHVHLSKEVCVDAASALPQNTITPTTDVSDDDIEFVLSADVNSVIRAVIVHGADQYFDIGIALGLNRSQINAAVAAIPAYSGKLRGIIEIRKSAIGDDALVKQLVDTCCNLPDPIIADIIRHLKN